jgi:hypothetical protein
MRPVSTFEGASTQTDVPALREDSEPVNNGPSDAEFFADTEQDIARGGDSTKRKRSVKKNKYRCRKCGKEYAPPEWKPFHRDLRQNTTAAADTSHKIILRNQDETRVWEHCTVPKTEYEDGFPCPAGAKLSCRKKTKTRIVT